MRNIFSKLFGRNKSAPKVEVKSAGIPISSGSWLHYVLSGGSTITASQAAMFYRNTAAVATAVDMIADGIEQITPVVETEDGKFEMEAPVLEFLKHPNGFQQWHRFIGDLARHYLLKHDVLMTSAGNIKRPPIEVWPISLQSATVMEGSDQYPQSYLITDGPIKGQFNRNELKREFGARFYDGNLKELFHVMGYASKTVKIQADSPLQAAANEARQIIKGKNHNLKLLDNGGRLSLLIAFNDDGAGGVSDDEHRERVKRINEQYGGAENAGKIGVISNADISKVVEMGKTNKDMDYSQLESMAASAVYLRYKVPLPLVTNAAATYNNMETAIEMLYDNAVLPLADVLFAGLTAFLFPRYGLDASKTRLTYNPESIEPLKKRRLAEVEQRKKIAIETTNELRSLLPNREPIENGDTLYQAANLVPIGEDLFTEDNNAT